MKTIIVATDYSEAANNALQYAAKLASTFKADLILFNAFYLPVHASNSLLTPAGIDQMIDHSKDRLQQLAVETAQKYRLNVSWVSKISNTIGELEECVKECKADLVVMGMESDLIEYKLFGNTTTSAIRRLPCPVMVVPTGVSFKEIDKILFACEYRYLDKENKLELLKALAKRFKAELQIFHVETHQKDTVPMALDTQIINAVDDLLEEVNHTYSYIEDDDIGKGLNKGIQAFQPDLLVMVPHKAGFFESLFKGSTTRKMTLTTHVPLLVLPNA